MEGVPLKRSSPFSLRQSSKPSTSGIFVSERMRSGGEISHFSSASLPFTAVVTEKPAFLSETSITHSDLGSPSTRSRCCFATWSSLRFYTGGSAAIRRRAGVFSASRPQHRLAERGSQGGFRRAPDPGRAPPSPYLGFLR